MRNHAVNLDGGGSTQMWVRARNETCQDLKDVGCLVNHPAYGWERPRNEAITLVPTAWVSAAKEGAPRRT